MALGILVLMAMHCNSIIQGSGLREGVGPWGSHLSSVLVYWRINNSMALNLMGGSENYRRWDLTGVSRSLGTCPGMVYLVPSPFLLFSLLPCCQEAHSSALHTLPTTTSASSRPIAMEAADQAETSESISKSIFLTWRKIQVFCHSDKKLTTLPS